MSKLDSVYAKLQVKTGAKMALIVLDGLGDLATRSQNWMTPLEAAKTPNLDAQAPLPEAPQLLEALERVGLTPRVGPPERWRHHGDLVALPWQEEAAPCA